MIPVRQSRTYVAGQLRLLLALAAGFDRRPFGAVGGALAGRPRLEDVQLAGVPVALARPGRGRGPWPALVVVPGVTRDGRAHPAFVGIARGLAGCGLLTAVVEPAGLSSGELTLESVQQVRAAAEAVASEKGCREGRVALAGVSGGGTLALLAAADPGLAGRVSAVAALAPCCDVREALRLATTGLFEHESRLLRFETGDFFRLAIARSAVAWLAEGRDRKLLRVHLEALEDYGPQPLAGLRAWSRDDLGEEARAVVELLGNEDPDRFEALFAALPERLQHAAGALSAVRAAGRIRAPVELVVGRDDKYLPLADATGFATACATARLTVVDSLTHAVPRLGRVDLRDTARLNGAAVRLLRAAAAPSYSRP